MTRAVVLALVAGSLALARPAAAHDVSVGVLALEERQPGRWELAWTPPVDSRAAPAEVDFELPAGCAREGRVATCEPGPLRGTITFAGMHEPRMQVLVAIRALDGTVTEQLVTGAAPTAALDAPAGRTTSFLGWVRIGIEHVLGGLDHLAFVLGMLLVVGWAPRRLAATITAFTLAHSTTLLLAGLDLVRLPAAPVEATIAASVVLLAREALTTERTLTHDRPWWVAAGFGLVHGLGFAGALGEVGVPRGSLPVALAGFNVGIELGQIAVLAAALAIAWAGRGVRLPERGRAPLAYALGTAGAFWLVERAARIVAG